MNTISIEAAWIVPHLFIAMLALIEACKYPERCIYSDFGDIRLHFASKNTTLSTLLSSKQCFYKKHDYSMSDILRAGHWLSIMRAFSILPFMILMIIILLPTLEFLFISDLNVSSLVHTYIWPTLYMVEFIILFLRISSRAVRILKKLHQDYKDIPLYSILIFKYIKK